MRAFYALVHKDEDSAFGVSFPDLPEVFSASDTENDIVLNAIEALELWAEDAELPVPSTLESLRLRPDVKDALKQGAFIVRVPLIENDTRVVRANVTFEAGTLRAIDAAARKRGLSRSAFLANAAKREIESA